MQPGIVERALQRGDLALQGFDPARQRLQRALSLNDILRLAGWRVGSRGTGLSRLAASAAGGPDRP